MEVTAKRRGISEPMWLNNIRNDLSEKESCQRMARKTEASHKKRRSHIKVGKDAEEAM